MRNLICLLTLFPVVASAQSLQVRLFQRALGGTNCEQIAVLDPEQSTPTSIMLQTSRHIESTLHKTEKYTHQHACVNAHDQGRMLVELDVKFFGILGTTLSALFAAWAYYAKIRYEHRRATRVVLYYVLELHHVAARWNESTVKFPKAYLEKCNSILKQRNLKLSESDHQVIEVALSALLRQTAIGEIERSIKDMSAPYLKALEDLSKENPILAFRLKGREGFDKPSRFVQDYADRESAKRTKESLEELNFLKVESEDFIRGIAARELQNAVLLVAWNCGLWTYWKCKILMKNQHNQTALTELDADINDLLGKFFQGFHATAL